MKNITVAIDFDEESEDILRVAEDLATAAGAELHLVHIYPPTPDNLPLSPYVYPMPIEIEDPEVHQEIIRDQGEDLRKMVDALHEKDIAATGVMKPAPYDIPAAIREFAGEKNSDLIVMGSHRPGRLERLVLGSIAESVMRKSDIPVLVVPRNKGEKE